MNLFYLVIYFLIAVNYVGNEVGVEEGLSVSLLLNSSFGPSISKCQFVRVDCFQSSYMLCYLVITLLNLSLIRR